MWHLSEPGWGWTSACGSCWGPPGAGKGTQADRIAARFQLVHLATGDLLRANVADGTPLGEVAQAYLDSGELVPDEVVVAMMLERLTQPDCARVPAGRLPPQRRPGQGAG